MEHAGYRTVRHTMKLLLMDMFVPAEQENKNVPKFGTRKRITKRGSFFVLNFKRKRKKNENSKTFQGSAMERKSLILTFMEGGAITA